MTKPDDDILDDVFLGCAFEAFLQQARMQQTWPDSEATRQLAYRMYEDALAERNVPAVDRGQVGATAPGAICESDDVSMTDSAAASGEGGTHSQNRKAVISGSD